MITAKNIVSLFIGVTILSLTFNPFRNILDIPHQSAIFVISFLSCAIAIFTLIFSQNPRSLRITAIDLWVILIAIGGIYFNHPFSKLFDWGCFSLLLIYWSIRQVGKINAIILYNLSLVAVFVLSLIGYLQNFQILQPYHLSFAITGPFGNPSIYAGVLCLLINVPIIGLLYLKKRPFLSIHMIISILVIILAIIMLWMTRCRSAWIAFIIVFAYIVNYRFQLLNGLRSSKRICFFLGIGVLFSILSFAYVLYQVKPASAEGRILIWKITSQMIKKKPISGFGTDGFNADYMNFQAEYLKTKGSIREKSLADNNHSVYNEPLRWIVEYGIGGLLLYVCVLCLILFYKPSNLKSLSSKSVLIAGLLWGFFSNTEQAFPILVITIIALAVLSNFYPVCWIRLHSKGFPLLRIILFTVALWQGYMSVHMYQSHRCLFQIFHQAAGIRSDDLLKKLITFETKMKNEKCFWGTYCHLLNKCRKDSVLLEKIGHWKQLYPSSETYILQGDVYRRLGRQYEAEKSYWTAHYMVPSRQKARTRLAKLYYEQGRISQALDLAKEVLSEKVKVYGFETFNLHAELQQIIDNQ